LTTLNNDLKEENRVLRDQADAARMDQADTRKDKEDPRSAPPPQTQPPAPMAARADSAVVSKQRIDSFQQAMSDFLNCAKYVFLSNVV
jgi:hypothetical protein